LLIVEGKNVVKNCAVCWQEEVARYLTQQQQVNLINNGVLGPSYCQQPPLTQNGWFLGNAIEMAVVVGTSVT